MLATYLISYCGRACSYRCVAAQGYCCLWNSLLHIEQKSESKILFPFCYSNTKYYRQKFTFIVVLKLNIILLCCASSLSKLCWAVVFILVKAIFIGNRAATELWDGLVQLPTICFLSSIWFVWFDTRTFLWLQYNIVTNTVVTLHALTLHLILQLFLLGSGCWLISLTTACNPLYQFNNELFSRHQAGFAGIVAVWQQ
mgnify:CR=1 FL=1